MTFTAEIPSSRVVTTYRATRNFGLDLMRACAIIMVFLSHTNSLNPLSKVFPWFGWFGCGVEAFFVLSGFLIGRIILRMQLESKINWQSVRVFWINRWLRTIPAYLVALTLEYYFTGFTRHAGVYLFFAQNLITPMQGFFSHSWSLAVEEWFYILFPLALLFAVKILGTRVENTRIYYFTACSFIVFGLLTKLSYHLMYQQQLFTHLIEKGILFKSWKIFAPPMGNFDEMRKMVIYRIDAIAYGCITAYLMLKFNLSVRVKQLLLVVGISSLLACFIVMGQTVGSFRATTFSDIVLLPFFCISFALMLPAVESCPRPGKIVNAVFTSISKVSYSFYLLHLLIVNWIISYYQNNPQLAPKWVVYLCTFLLIYLVSLLMYRTIELPFMNYRKKIFKATK